MGRHQKLTAMAVLELLEEQGQLTINNLADHFHVVPATVRSRLKELRMEGESIIHNRSGLMLINKEDILNDEEIAKDFKNWINWGLSIISSVILSAKPTQPLLPALRKSLKESLSSNERKQLAHSCVRIKALLDYMEVDEEDEPPKFVRLK